MSVRVSAQPVQSELLSEQSRAALHTEINEQWLVSVEPVLNNRDESQWFSIRLIVESGTEISSDLSGKGFEVRAFPWGTLLDVRNYGAVSGKNRGLDALDIVVPAFFPEPPLDETTTSTVRWPLERYDLRWGSSVAELQWTKGEALTYSGTWKFQPRYNPPLKITASGTAQGTLGFNPQGELTSHTMKWHRRVRFPSGVQQDQHFEVALHLKERERLASVPLELKSSSSSPEQRILSALRAASPVLASCPKLPTFPWEIHVTERIELGVPCADQQLAETELGFHPYEPLQFAVEGHRQPELIFVGVKRVPRALELPLVLTEVQAKKRQDLERELIKMQEMK